MDLWLQEWEVHLPPNERQEVQPRVDTESLTTSEVTEPKVPAKVLWTTIDESLKKVKVEKTAVHNFIASTVFPKLKFITGGGTITMNYLSNPRSICSLIMAGCHQCHTPEGMIWWAVAKKQTELEINRLRNDASKNMKAAFTGTSNSIQGFTFAKPRPN